MRESRLQISMPVFHNLCLARACVSLGLCLSLGFRLLMPFLSLSLFFPALLAPIIVSQERDSNFDAEKSREEREMIETLAAVVSSP